MAISIHGKASTPLTDGEDAWLGRKEFCQALIESITQIDPPVTIGLVGAWGSGKTRFLELLEADLRKRGTIMSVYFDAWARDFSEDPFASFCAEMHAQFARNNKTKVAETRVKLREKARKVIASTVGSGIKALGRASIHLAAAHTGLDPATAEAGSKVVEGPIEKAAEKISDAIAGSMQESIEKAPDARREFRSALEDVVAAIGDDSSGSDCKLLILVDEIDRCRPDFAIRLLETIKHFFNVPRVTFLIAYDEKYTISAAKALYGQSFDAENYLRRFIDVRFWLPASDAQSFVRKVIEHYDFRTAFASGRREDVSRLCDALVEYITCMKLSLRDTEQALASCRLFVGKNATVKSEIIHACTFLCVAKFSKPELISALVERRASFEKIADEFSSMFTAESSEWHILKTTFRYADAKEALLREIAEGRVTGMDEKTRHVVMSNMNAMGRNYGEKLLKYLNTIR